MKKKVLTILQYALFLGLGIFLVWWSIHKMDDKSWEECKAALRSARYFLFVPVFFILIASHFSRAMRWKILMAPLGYAPSLANTFFAVMIGYLANLAVPRLGEVLKCTILGKYEKVPADKLVGTILIERAVDVFSLLIVFAIAFLTQLDIIGAYAQDKIDKHLLNGNTQAIATKLITGLVILLTVWLICRFIFKKYGDKTFVKKISNIFKGVGAGLASIKHMQNKWAFIFHSIFIWACYVAGTYIGFFVIQETSLLPFAASFPVLAFASIGMIVTPGGIGTYQYIVKSIMLLYGIDVAYGLANGILQWAAQFFIILIAGFISLLALPYFNRGVVTIAQPSAEPKT